LEFVQAALICSWPVLVSDVLSPPEDSTSSSSTTVGRDLVSGRLEKKLEELKRERLLDTVSAIQFQFLY
jgi:hypothetical protein